MNKWIQSDQALLMILKHGCEICEQYQYYLDRDNRSLLDPEEFGYEIDDDNTEELFDFDDWYEAYCDQLEWLNSDEYRYKHVGNR